MQHYIFLPNIFREGYIHPGQVVQAHTILQPLQQSLLVDPSGGAQPTTFAVQSSDGSLIPVQLATSGPGGQLIMFMPSPQAQQTIYTTQQLAPTATTIDAAIAQPAQSTILSATVEEEQQLIQQAQLQANQVHVVHQNPTQAAASIAHAAGAQIVQVSSQPQSQVVSPSTPQQASATA
ncbi:unnamed protein product, partial [Protopolystoma xenopodis]